jgi:hypothetical protein
MVLLWFVLCCYFDPLFGPCSQIIGGLCYCQLDFPSFFTLLEETGRLTLSVEELETWYFWFMVFMVFVNVIESWNHVGCVFSKKLLFGQEKGPTTCVGPD